MKGGGEKEGVRGVLQGKRAWEDEGRRGGWYYVEGNTREGGEGVGDMEGRGDRINSKSYKSIVTKRPPKSFYYLVLRLQTLVKGLKGQTRMIQLND